MVPKVLNADAPCKHGPWSPRLSLKVSVHLSCLGRVLDNRCAGLVARAGPCLVPMHVPCGGPNSWNSDLQATVLPALQRAAAAPSSMQTPPCPEQLAAAAHAPLTNARTRACSVSCSCPHCCRQSRTLVVVFRGGRGGVRHAAGGRIWGGRAQSARANAASLWNKLQACTNLRICTDCWAGLQQTGQRSSWGRPLGPQ